MAETLRQSAPRLVTLRPTLAEALREIEETIQTIDETELLDTPRGLNKKPTQPHGSLKSRFRYQNPPSESFSFIGGEGVCVEAPPFYRFSDPV
jgi:hypothetical protein